MISFLKTCPLFTGVCYPFKLNLFRTRSRVRRAILIIFLTAVIFCAYKPILGFSADTDLITTEMDTKPDDRSFVQANKHEDLYLLNPRLGRNQTGTTDQSTSESTSRANSSISPGYAKTVFILDSCYAVLVTVLPFLVILSLNLRIITRLCQHTNTLLSEQATTVDSKSATALKKQSNSMASCICSSRVRKCFVIRRTHLPDHSKNSRSIHTVPNESESGRFGVGHHPVLEHFSSPSVDTNHPRSKCTHSSCSCSFTSGFAHCKHVRTSDQPVNGHHGTRGNPNCFSHLIQGFSRPKSTVSCFSHQQSHNPQHRRLGSRHSHGIVCQIHFKQPKRVQNHNANSIYKSSNAKNNVSHEPNQLRHHSSGGVVNTPRRGDRLGRQFAVTLLTISACFLLLNIPYLVAWTCRWYQVRLRLYAIDLNWSEYLTPLDPGTNSEPSRTDRYLSCTKQILKIVCQSFFTNDSMSADKQNTDVLQLNGTDFAASKFVADHEDHMDWLRVALPITRTIFSLNYCINFFLYSLVGKYFRRELCRLFWGCKYNAFARFCPARARQMVRQHQGRHQPAGGIRLNMWRPRASTEGVVLPTRFYPYPVNRPVCGVQVFGLNSNLISYIHTA